MSLRVKETFSGTASRVGRLGVRFLTAQRLAVSEFIRDRCMQRAAALSYTSIFSIVPLAAIYLFAVNVTGFLAEYQDKARDLVLRHFAPESREPVEKFITTLSDKLSDYAAHSGVVGFISFVAVSILVLITIESVFNDVWNVRRPRSFMKRVFIYWFVLCFVPISLATSAYVEARVRGSSVLGAILPTDAAEGVLFGRVVPLGITYLCFFVLYVFVPNTKVGYGAGLVGALLAGTLWEIAKEGFKVYVSNTVSFYQLFGSIAAIPIFFMWVYLSWLIVLYGAEVTYVLQHRHFIEIQRRSKTRHGPIHPDYVALLGMTEIARRFRGGLAPPTAEDLALRFGVPLTEIGETLESLLEAKLIHRVGESERFVVAKPPESIALSEILAAVGVRESALLEEKSGDMGRAVEVLARIRKETRAVFGTKTLHELLP